jgi:hypothetical protein
LKIVSLLGIDKNLVFSNIKKLWRFEWDDERLRALISLLKFEEEIKGNGVMIISEYHKHWSYITELKMIKGKGWKEERSLEEGKRFIILLWGRKMIIIDKEKRWVFLVQFWSHSSPLPKVYAVPKLQEEMCIRFLGGTNWKREIFNMQEKEYELTEQEKRELFNEINGEELKHLLRVVKKCLAL